MTDPGTNPSFEYPSEPVNPAINAESGLYDRVPSQEELATYSAEMSAYKAGVKARTLSEVGDAMELEGENTGGSIEFKDAPLRHSASSAGKEGPNSPWGATTFTGYYKTVNGEVIAQIGTEVDESDPTANHRVFWVPFSQIRSGRVTWQGTGSFSAFSAELPV